jgi:hypothetical protein
LVFLYGVRAEITACQFIAGGGIMSAFRTCRPLLVDATQCTEAGTISTDLGFTNVKRGDWVVRGEDGESYVVDDEFFQRTFRPIQMYPWERTEETRSYGC